MVVVVLCARMSCQLGDMGGYVLCDVKITHAACARWSALVFCFFSFDPSDPVFLLLVLVVPRWLCFLRRTIQYPPATIYMQWLDRSSRSSAPKIKHARGVSLCLGFLSMVLLHRGDGTGIHLATSLALPFMRACSVVLLCNDFSGLCFRTVSRGKWAASLLQISALFRNTRL